MALVGGRSNFDANGNLIGFDLSNSCAPANQQYLLNNDGSGLTPVITVTGLGLDVKDVSATEIIARSVKLIGSIYAGNGATVSIKTGDKNYNYVTKNVTSDSSYIVPTAADNAELFAIDASALSEIQAGRIFLIATKDGLGVNSLGTVAAQSTANIDAAGNVYYNKL